MCLVLNRITTDFREMTPNKAEALCCGGGGGLVALAEYAERWIAAGQPKADQIKSTGARVVVEACENCRLQIGDLNEHYNLNVRLTARIDLVVRPMQLPRPVPGTEHLFEGEAIATTKDWDLPKPRPPYGGLFLFRIRLDVY